MPDDRRDKGANFSVRGSVSRCTTAAETLRLVSVIRKALMGRIAA